VSSSYRPTDDDNAWLDDLLSDFGDEDAQYEEALEDERPPPLPPRSPLRRLAGWLAVAAVLAVIGFGLLQVGERTYNPASRLPPAPASDQTTGIYGTTTPLQAELTAIEGLMASGPLSLDGDAGRIAFPRSVADRLFGKRDEDALFFSAKTQRGDAIRVLVLRDDGKPLVVAAGRPSSGSDDFAGVYVGLPSGAVLDAVTPLVDEAASKTKRTYSEKDFTIFGPFEAGNTTQLRARVDANPVLRHEVDAIDAGGDDVSLAASAFLIAQPPGGNRTINALYQPSTNAVFQPLWGTNETDSLAHELVHAMMDEVLADERAAQRQAQAYLEANQPHLYEGIIGDLYQSLDPLGRAEEALAFITGALAAGQPTTVAPAQLLQNQGLIERSAGLLASDVDFLIGLGILPACMKPASLGYEKPTIDFAYFRLVDKACAPAP
jgi:hypothetical protein